MSEEKTVRKNMPVSEADPRPGCLMFAVGGFVLLTLGTWAAYTYFAQKAEYLKFTSPTQAPLVAPAYEVSAMESAVRKLSDATAKEISLTAQECMAIMATHPLATSLNKQVVLTSIDTELHFDTAIEFTTLGTYLNAKITAKPVIEPETGLSVQTTHIEIPGKEVPAEFIKGYNDEKFFAQLLMPEARKNKEVGAFLRRVKTATLRDGHLVLGL